MKKIKDPKVVRGWEIYHDPCYYDLWAVRVVGERNFNHTFHFLKREYADDFVKWNTPIRMEATNGA